MVRAADLEALAERAAGCRDCDLWRDATQVVFGAGGDRARLFLVGEQPGDQEDQEGEPFVGPAGKLLQRALAELSLEPAAVYLTNAVKHFKWEPAGKVRLHKRPNAEEIRACRQWLVAELAVVEPVVIGCLGATAARTVLGRAVRVRDARGIQFQGPGATATFVTVHPSAVLRAREDRDAMYRMLVADLHGMAERAGLAVAGRRR